MSKKREYHEIKGMDDKTEGLASVFQAFILAVEVHITDDPEFNAMPPGKRRSHMFGAIILKAPHQAITIEVKIKEGTVREVRDHIFKKVAKHGALPDLVEYIKKRNESKD